MLCVNESDWPTYRRLPEIAKWRLVSKHFKKGIPVFHHRNRRVYEEVLLNVNRVLPESDRVVAEVVGGDLALLQILLKLESELKDETSDQRIGYAILKLKDFRMALNSFVEADRISGKQMARLNQIILRCDKMRHSKSSAKPVETNGIFKFSLEDLLDRNDKEAIKGFLECDVESYVDELVVDD